MDGCDARLVASHRGDDPGVNAIVIENGGINWTVLGLLFLEVVLLFALATPEHARNARASEARAAISVFGEDRAERALHFASTNFHRHIVEKNIEERSYQIFVPTDENRERAGRVGEMTPWLFVWVRDRLEGFWAMVLGIYHRAALLGFAMMIAVPVIWVSLVDGLVERKIRIFTDGVSTPVFYHGAKGVFSILLLAPLFILALPFSVSPSIWYAWLLILPIVIWVSSRNVQEL
ncbi:MAG: DUF4400 domain-containing protein [Gammaproteobacteria bacterium]|nr:MAG: DUF4400 domain-containing protein [Gammaproteobacteria bacterium]